MPASASASARASETRRLFEAVNRRDCRASAAAIAGGADPNALVGPGGDPHDSLAALHNAMQWCDPALVRTIAEASMRAGVSLDWARPSGLRGHTPLMMPPTLRPAATPARRAETIVAALEAGARASIDDRGATGIVMEDDADLSYTALLWLLFWGRENESAARALLDAGAKSAWQRVERPNHDFGRERLGSCNHHGADALMLAVQRSFSSSFVLLLLDKGACLGHFSVMQRTALMLAIEATRSREPAVAAAASAAAATIVKWVRACGAELEVLAWPASLPPTRMSDALEVPDPNGYRALHYASSFGLALLVTALVDAGADKEAHCICGWTPLMVAAGSRKAGAVRALLEKGAFANNHDGLGATALHVAITHSANGDDLSCVDALLAWPDTDVHAATITGLSPLALAQLTGNVIAEARLRLRMGEDAAGGRCGDGAEYERLRIAALSVKQLRAELAARNIDVAGLSERGELVGALLAPPSAATKKRMEEQLTDVVEKVSYIGMPASPKVFAVGPSAAARVPICERRAARLPRQRSHGQRLHVGPRWAGLAR